MGTGAEISSRIELKHAAERHENRSRAGASERGCPQRQSFRLEIRRLFPASSIEGIGGIGGRPTVPSSSPPMCRLQCWRRNDNRRTGFDALDGSPADRRPAIGSIRLAACYGRPSRAMKRAAQVLARPKYRHSVTALSRLDLRVTILFGPGVNRLHLFTQLMVKGDAYAWQPTSVSGRI